MKLLHSFQLKALNPVKKVNCKHDDWKVAFHLVIIRNNTDVKGKRIERSPFISSCFPYFQYGMHIVESLFFALEIYLFNIVGSEFIVWNGLYPIALLILVSGMYYKNPQITNENSYIGHNNNKGFYILHGTANLTCHCLRIQRAKAIEFSKQGK